MGTNVARTVSGAKSDGVVPGDRVDVVESELATIKARTAAAPTFRLDGDTLTVTVGGKSGRVTIVWDT